MLIKILLARNCQNKNISREIFWSRFWFLCVNTCMTWSTALLAISAWCITFSAETKVKLSTCLLEGFQFLWCACFYELWMIFVKILGHISHAVYILIWHVKMLCKINLLYWTFRAVNTILYFSRMIQTLLTLKALDIFAVWGM